jgi:hypothetical protein
MQNPIPFKVNSIQGIMTPEPPFLKDSCIVITKKGPINRDEINNPKNQGLLANMNTNVNASNLNKQFMKKNTYESKTQLKSSR